MLDLKNLNSALDQLAEEKGISKEKRDYGKKTQIVRAEFDIASGKAKFSQIKLVVDESMIKTEEEIVAEEAAREEFKKEPQNERFEAREAAREALMEERGEELADGEIKKVRFNPERHI